MSRNSHSNSHSNTDTNVQLILPQVPPDGGNENPQDASGSMHDDDDDDDNQQDHQQQEEEDQVFAVRRRPSPTLGMIICRLLLPAMAWGGPVLYLYWMRVRGLWEFTYHDDESNDNNNNSSSWTFLPLWISYGIGQVLAWMLLTTVYYIPLGTDGTSLSLYGQVQDARQSCDESSDARSRSSSPQRRSLSPAAVAPVWEQRSMSLPRRLLGNTSTTTTTTTTTTGASNSSSNVVNANTNSSTNNSTSSNNHASQQSNEPQQQLPVGRPRLPMARRRHSNPTSSSTGAANHSPTRHQRLLTRSYSVPRNLRAASHSTNTEQESHMLTTTNNAAAATTAAATTPIAPQAARRRANSMDPAAVRATRRRSVRFDANVHVIADDANTTVKSDPTPRMLVNDNDDEQDQQQQQQAQQQPQNNNNNNSIHSATTTTTTTTTTKTTLAQSYRELAQVRRRQALHQQSWQRWKRQRVMHQQEQQAGLSNQAAEAAADEAHEQAQRQRQTELAHQEDDLLRQIQVLEESVAATTAVHKNNHVTEPVPVPVESVNPSLAPPCTSHLWTLLEFVSLWTSAFLQLLHVWLLGRAVMHVSATVVALIHATLWIALARWQARKESSWLSTMEAVFVWIICVVAMAQIVSVAWWHAQNLNDDYDAAQYGQHDAPQGYHVDNNIFYHDDDKADTSSCWWQGILYGTAQAVLAIFLYATDSLLVPPPQNIWSRLLRRPRPSPPGSPTWIKRLTTETFLVALCVTSGMAVKDIRHELPWQDDSDDDDDDNEEATWSDEAITWGGLALLWAAAKVVWLLAKAPAAKKDDGPTVDSLGRLAPTLAAVLVWIVLLLASHSDQDLQDDHQDWLLPDSLLYLGATGMLTAAWTVSSHAVV